MFNFKQQLLFRAGSAMRWFVKIDGASCTLPAAIDAHAYEGVANDYHYPANIGGYCLQAGNLPILKGEHTVAFAVTNHNGDAFRDAYACWQSACRLVIEEVPPPEGAFPGNK